MAILLRGKTECPICGRVIEEGDAAALFAHFVVNEADPLFRLSDTACHLACIESTTLGRSMSVAWEQYLANTGPGRRICAVCGEEIQDPDDYLSIGYLADPERDPLGQFNFTHLHKSHMKSWTKADEFLVLAKAALVDGRGKGSALVAIIRSIEVGSE